MVNFLDSKKVYFLLKLSVFGEFLGHGIFAIQGKAQWVGWISQLTGVDSATATTMLLVVGFIDITVAVWILLKPNNIVLSYAIFWGFFTALLRPIVGEPIWDFVERWANWGAPLALMYLSKRS